MAKGTTNEYSAGQALSLAFDKTIAAITVTGGGGSTSDGGTFTAGTDTATPIEGVYEASPSSVATGKYGVIGIDSTRNLKVTQATLLAGEDLTANVIKVEQRFSYSPVATADVQIKGSAGFLHSITFAPNDATPTAGSIILYDSLTEAGTQIFNWNVAATAFLPFTVTIDAPFATGLYLGFATTNDVNVTVSYR